MGLAVSQVRLLALTTRKADIELRMQVNSKRKQMLTRKSTELAQQYYNRLQDSNIQYATSAGYEDVNYDYIMGKTNAAGRYTEDFIKQIRDNSADQNAYPRKIENKMILTDQYGQVVCNNQMAEIVKKVDLSYPSELFTTNEKTAFGIVELIKQCKNEGLDELYGTIATPSGSIDTDKLNQMLEVLQYLIQNEGNYEGGTVYCSDLGSGKYFLSKEGQVTQNMDNTVQLVPGYRYTIMNQNQVYGGDSKYESCVYKGNNIFISNKCTNREYIKRLANIVSYFAPILSAAITNGTSAKVDVLSGSVNYHTVNADPASTNWLTPPYNYQPGDYIVWQDSGNKSVKGYYKITSTGAAQKMGSTLSPTGQKKAELTQDYPPSQSELAEKLPNLGDYLIFIDPTGTKTYYQTTAINSDGSPYVERYRGDNSAALFYEDFIFTTRENSEYYTATNTNELQSGFKSGVYQFCMVDDVAKGIYHKNTTMKFFTHMNYVVDKADSSKREEITAWFNAENAAISEQETYWDSEIQNLSTELTSVTAEIESVKKLKSDSIKNVFNWGGN